MITLRKLQMNLKKAIVRKLLFPIIIILSVFSAMAQQISIDRINQMPDIPDDYEMREWKQVAIAYDNLVFNQLATGTFFPLVKMYPEGLNYPSSPYFGIQSYVGHLGSGLEAINVLPAVIGATLCGIDKSDQHDYNWVLACQEFFNKKNGQMVYLNNTQASSGHDWWYDVMPNVFFYQLNDLYPHTGDFDFQFTKVADRWLDAVQSLGGSTTPWNVPYMNYRAFDLTTGQPLESGIPEPEAAGAIAWILYHAFQLTQNQEYRIGAELCLEFLNEWETNPSYELQLPYGIYIAARMNAEIGTNYNIEKMMNWAFDVGDLRQWGAIVGKWNGYEASGLIGEAKPNYRDYAFLMNGFQQMGALLPMLSYDDRFACALGKWCLNVASASRLFYGKYLPDQNQSNPEWPHSFDPESCIAYEALKESENNISPMATGDAMAGGWAQTNLGLYGSSHVGVFGAIIDTSQISGILKLDVNATNYYAENIFPLYLLYNPYDENKTLALTNSIDPLKIYDAVTNKIISESAIDDINITIPAKCAVLAYVLPADAVLSQDGNKTICNGVIIDYNNGSGLSISKPRIKALACRNDSIQINVKTDFYCTAVDANSNNLRYFWTVDGNTIEADSVLSYEFNQTSDYLLICVVKDDGNHADTANLWVHIVEKIIKAPIIKSIEAFPPKIKTGEQTSLICIASDPNLDELTYEWSATGGFIQENNNQAIFTAPQQAGIYYVNCLVSDIDQCSTMDSISVVVYDDEAQQNGKLIAYYRFSNSVGDNSGNGHTGSAFNCSFVDDLHGNPKKAISLTSKNSWIDIPNDDHLNFNKGLTLSMILKASTLVNREMFIISHGSWEQRWKISILDNGRMRFTVNTSNGIADLDSKTILQQGEYYHLTAIYNGNTMELYINGKAENFRLFSGDINTTDCDLVMGRNFPESSVYSFQGGVDELRIFDYGISYQLLQEYYQLDLNAIENLTPSQDILKMHPNPASGNLILEFYNLRNTAIIQILSLQGKCLFKQQISAETKRTNIDISDLDPAMYMISISSADQKQCRRLIVY